ncbi:MAG TPA: winged helix-turn-helix domain-containing protein [Pseudolabrys sp.]|nr:winged helix-turn-helix domain-containing protein [Pseudolabrys sp.]
MPAESTTFDPYDTVLADLKAKRDQIDQAIAAIEAVRGGGVLPSIAGGGEGPNIAVDSPGAFLGLSIQEATKKLLAAKRRPLKNPEIVAAFKAGGLMLGSKDPVNTVGAVLTRRSVDVGDIVKVGRGTWGLKEWFPGRSFKKKLDEAGTSEPE